MTKVTTKVPSSCVVTLTYDQAHLPPHGMLVHKDFQDFMKRLRIWRVRKTPNREPIRFFMCGELGGKTRRPHFHAILYGVSFSDRIEVQDASGKRWQTSSQLAELWPFGMNVVDEFSYAGAAYVAGYVAKKQVEHDQAEVVDPTTGEVVREYRKMSMRLPKAPNGDRPPGGLGGLWARDNLHRIYETDSVQIGEFAFPPPRYYDILLERYRPDLVPAVKERRQAKMVEAAREWSPERCSAAAEIDASRLVSRSDSL